MSWGKKPNASTNQNAQSELLWWRRGAIGLVAALVIGMLVFVGIRVNAADATIAGTVNFTALRPDPGDEGTVTIMYREKNRRGDFKSTGQTTPLQDGATFTWDGASSGRTYEMKALLEVRGQATGTSEVIVVTAPARAVDLPIKVTWKDLPPDVVAGSSTKIGGTAHVQGFIPENSKIVIQAQGRDQSVFQDIETLEKASIENTWTWANAIPLQTYQVRALLVDKDGKQIGSSETILVEAGEVEVKLVLTSGANPPEEKPAPTPTPAPTNAPQPTAQPTPPPVQNTTISGRIFVNGPIAQGSTLLLLQRKPGEGDFQAITRLQNVRQGGMDWVWKGARSGQQYEIQVALQVNEQNTATARAQIITAPATNIDFTINTGVSIQTPTAEPQVENCRDRTDGRWDATIVFPTVADAQQYWLRVGANPGSSEMFNQRVSAGNNQDVQRVTVTVDSGRNYFAQYAFALCTDCANDQNFSNFSNPWRFHCGDAPKPGPGDFRGYRCNQNTKVCEATNDANAPFAPNNAGLEQCQRACR